ncbi:hypothetical protein [Ignatzschineria cameli]|uniref:hypothetical protein n=1 Tax=Ignatzschineria cameli TaxID=2182793 RepID=UPI000D61BBCA|nr:hypothetical protein [Ignatzschineria cameli]PWD86443.1 hypothetical protein DC080_02030 [Ignatzschineria cameli]
MKKQIIGYTLSLALFAGSVGYSAPLDLFEENYKNINREIIGPGLISQLSDYAIEIESTTKSENVADFTTNLLMDFGGTSNQVLKGSEKGEVVFTNYGEGQGVATLLSKGTLSLYQEEEGESILLLKAENIEHQGQIDQENGQYKLNYHYPQIMLFNDDGSVKVATVDQIELDGVYGFSQNFKKRENVNINYKSGKITIEPEDRDEALVMIEGSNGYWIENNGEKVQKFLFELNKIAVKESDEDQPFSEILIDRLTYAAGAELLEEKPYIHGHFGLDKIEVKVPSYKHEALTFGDVYLKLQLTELSDDLFEKLEVLRLSEAETLNEVLINSSFKVSDFVVPGSRLNLELAGDLDESRAEVTLSIMPNAAFIEKVSTLDLESPDAFLEAFSGLTFFEFVNQYVDDLVAKLMVDKRYFIDLGSNILLSQDEAENRDMAKRQMNEFYKEFMVLAMVVNSGMPVIEFSPQGISSDIRYNNGVWSVNGQEIDLELIASMFSE